MFCVACDNQTLEVEFLVLSLLTTNNLFLPCFVMLQQQKLGTQNVDVNEQK